MLSRAKGYETHVPLHLWNARNGVPRSIPVGNDPQAKGKVTGEMAPENQFFSTSKAGAVVGSLGPFRNYLAVTGWAMMTYLFKCMLKTGYCIYYIWDLFL